MINSRTLEIFRDSFKDIAADFDLYFKEENISMIEHLLLRTGRLQLKCRELFDEHYKDSSDSFHLKSILKLEIKIVSQLSLWHEKLAYYYENQHEYERAEKEWLCAIQHRSDRIVDQYIQFAHATLRVHALFASRPIEENYKKITEGNVKGVVAALRKANTAIKYVILEQGENQVASNILDWVEKMEQEINSTSNFVKILNGNQNNETLGQVLTELHELVGLLEVKGKVQEISDYVQFNRLRQEQGFKANDLSFHMVFKGNPGTGKTVVARLVARVLKTLGILKSGHLVEVDRSDLVAEYVGQTAIKTSNKIQEAMDGVLFIDEAYSLTRSTHGTDFGVESIDTLIKAMEDYRERLVVIFAGYPDEMDNFIKSNPGLKSRIQNHITFSDYSLNEMMKICQLMLRKKQFQFNDRAFELFQDVIQREMELHPYTHGNGRLIRNLIESAILIKATVVVEQKEKGKSNLVDLDTIDELVLSILQNRPIPQYKVMK